MDLEKNNLRFFLGANTPQGFVSRFEQLADAEDGWREYVIKGGPGSGKSTMMKKIIAALEEECPDIEIIHCSSDVDSVDAVIVPERRFSIADGTPPHARAYFITHGESPQSRKGFIIRNNKICISILTPFGDHVII